MFHRQTFVAAAVLAAFAIVISVGLYFGVKRTTPYPVPVMASVARPIAARYSCVICEDRPTRSTLLTSFVMSEVAFCSVPAKSARADPSSIF